MAVSVAITLFTDVNSVSGIQNDKAGGSDERLEDFVVRWMPTSVGTDQIKNVEIPQEAVQTSPESEDGQRGGLLWTPQARHLDDGKPSMVVSGVVKDAVKDPVKAIKGRERRHVW